MTTATPITPSTQIATAWNVEFDELATHLMVEGPGPRLTKTLQQLRSKAEDQHASAAIGLLDAALKSLAQDPQAGAQYLLEGGLADLQDALMARPKSPPPAPAMSLGEDPELVTDFLVEAREHLSNIEVQMLALERDPGCMEVIHAVFRAFHTIKGLAAFLDFQSVKAIAHEVETILDLARNEKLVITPAAVDVILESGDFLTNELSLIEHSLKYGGELHPNDYQALAIKIASLARQDTPATPIAVSAALEASAHVPAAPNAVPQEPKPKPARKAQARVNTAAPQSPSTLAVESAEPIGTTFSDQDGNGFIKLYSKKERAALKKEAHKQANTATSAQSEAAVTSPGTASPARASVSPLPMAKPVAVMPSSPIKEPLRTVSEAGSVRVDTAKLDHLMDMVGEIVIAQSLIRHNPAFSAASDSRLLSDLAQLARATGEMQRATMSMRMVPVGHVFQRVERVIRDLSRKAGKLVVLETFGADTEIDKTVAEELSDPLLHMVRNSVDHGIEMPEERKAAGKAPEARIKLSARHQSGLVVIEIADDGRGLNPAKIRQKAEERGLIAPHAQLTEQEIHHLIFEPGFSTADKVTDVSGRGVGMDVVRRNVEKLRGRIEIHSKFGEGTTFALKLPLTLAIIDGLVVEVGKDRFIIPISAIREMFRSEDEAHFTVEGRAEMLLVRGQLLPIIRLDQHMGIQGRANKPSEGLTVVVESHGKPFCLVVDDLLGKQEVVIKSLGETFKDASALSGCAVLGDGCVGLILDVDGIFRGGVK